jgi:phosphatidylglycerol lysyltransferase
MQVRTETGATLAELGYLVNPMGTDATVRLGDFGLHGARMRNLRRRRNQGRSAGLEVREQSFAEVNRDQVLEISRAWREHVKAGRTERRFLSFPFLADDEPGQRKFFGYSAQGELLGFVFFTPVYRAGGVTGYAPNVIRTAPDALPATGDFILLEALLRFQSEGLTWLVLGLCPTREAEVEGPFPGEPTVQRLVRQHMETLDRKFGFLTLSFHKLRYLPEEEPFYWAFPGEDVLRYLIGGLQLTGLF